MHKLLLVEDEPALRMGLRHALRRKGYDVETAATGADGLKLVEGGGFDVVITDLRLPDLDGSRLLEKALRTSTQTGVVVITGSADAAMRAELFKAGAYDCVSKPFTPDELLTIVENLLERHAAKREYEDASAAGAPKACCASLHRDADGE